jgi:hypothetical protein
MGKEEGGKTHASHPWPSQVDDPLGSSGGAQAGGVIPDDTTRRSDGIPAG